MCAIRLFSVLPGRDCWDEATQEETGNLFIGEICQFYCLWDIQVLPLSEKLDDIFEYTWISRT
jgi:hypothetical protein